MLSIFLLLIASVYSKELTYHYATFLTKDTYLNEYLLLDTCGYYNDTHLARFINNGSFYVQFYYAQDEEGDFNESIPCDGSAPYESYEY